MVAAIDEHLTSLADASEECRAMTLANHRASLGSVHQRDADIAAWLDTLSGPTTQLIATARRELALAEYSAASGLYRQSFASLRLFLELNCAAIHFSVNELERRQWISGRIDFSWSSAINSDDGVFSRTFVQEFSPGLIEIAREYGQTARDSYRYCSEFVHGKHKDSLRLPTTLTYSREIAEEWCTNAKNVAEVVLFLLYMRHGELIGNNPDHPLHSAIYSQFGHIEAVRHQFGS